MDHSDYSHTPETDSAPTQVVSKDNRLLAVIAMNISAACATGMTASYRIAAEGGFHAADFNLIRNVLSFCISVIWCCSMGYGPIKLFPSHNK